MEEKKYTEYTFVLIVLTTLVRFYIASTTGLGVDEAHYVQYALHPALSYYDHPPLTGYLIRFFIIAIGKSLINVRMPAIISGVGTSCLLFLLCRKLYGVKAGFWTVLIFNCIPLFSAVGGITVVPDTILCFLWLVIIFLAWNIYETGEKYLWYLTGIITGLSLLTKYTAFLIYPSFLLFILLIPSMRRRMKEKEPYIAFLISIIIFLPVIIWNYENHWASFLFQFSHGLGEKKLFDGEIFLKNIGAQAGIFSPFIFFLLIYTLIWVIKQSIRKDDKSILILSFSLPVILLFTYSGLSNEVLPHWPAAGYLSLLPVLGNITYGIFSSVKKRLRYLFLLSLITGGMLTIIIPVQILLRPIPLSPDVDISQDITGWKELAERIREIKTEEKEKDFFVFTHKFYIASQLAYYLEPDIPVYCLSKSVDQYDFWQYPENLKISLSRRNGLFFCDDQFKTTPEKFYKFSIISPAKVLPVHYKKRQIKNFYIYRCYNFDTEKTDNIFLQSLSFTPRSFKAKTIEWNEMVFFLINRYSLKNRALDIFFVSLNWLGSSFVLIPIVLVILFLKGRNQTGKYLFVFLFSLLLGDIIVHILKEVFSIPRPLAYFGKEAVNVLGPPLKKGSFPSGHSQTVFTGVLLLCWIMPGWCPVFIITGLLSCISRCYIGAHFPLDIAGGIVIAVVSFFTARMVFEKRMLLKEFYTKNRKIFKKALCLVILLLLCFLLIPQSRNRPVYVDTQQIAEDIKIIKPIAVKIFTPFTDFPLYFINAFYPSGQLLSLFIWLTLIWLIYGIIRFRNHIKEMTFIIIRGIFVIFISLLLLIICGVFLPVQRYKLTPKNSDSILMDIHSHTIYSHDGIVTPFYNFQWHKNYGFHCWAITEHSHTGPATIFQEEIIRRNKIPLAVIPAQEIRFKGVHLNLLGIERDINPKNFNILSELINTVHREGGAVIVPHIWAEKKAKLSLEELADAGVDGFEIAGISSIPLTIDKQKDLIEFCRKKGLVMVSGTNWHGWNNLCNVWTLFNVDNWNELRMEQRKYIVLEALRKRETDRFRVITYHYNYASKNFVFEPLKSLYLYIASLDRVQRFSWIFWLVVIYLLINFIKDKRRLAITIWFTITSLLILKALYFLELWNSVKTINAILPDISKWLFVIAIITLFAGLSNIKHRQ